MLKSVAWLHTLHMEFDQTYDRLTASPENPFGEPGRDYGEEYEVTSTPLYALPEPAADLVEVVADSIEEMLDAEDGWMVGTPELRSMCRDFATAALTALAPHMAAIRDAALDEAAEACIEQREAYLSPQYATGQPLSSIMERMACTTCSDAILALKDKP